MPFKSVAQQRFMFSQHPQIAKRFAAETPNFKALPDHVSAVLKGRLGSKKKQGMVGTRGNDYAKPDFAGEVDGKLGPTQEG